MQTAENTYRAQHSLAHGLEQLTQEISSLSARLGSAPLGRPGNVRVREPFMFDGKAKNIAAWVRDVRAAISLQRNALNPDLISQMQERVEQLVQSGSVANYTSQYCELIQYLDYSATMLLDMYKRGLKQEILKGVTIRGEPKNFEEYVKVATDLDNALFRAHRNEQASRLRQQFAREHITVAPSTSQHYVSSSPVSSLHSDVVPMEVDAVCRGPISAEERLHRQKEGLCFYCGKGKHLASACPNKKPSGSNNQKQATPASGKA
ncbi:hypothetical protein K474DRAFT_1723542 [Panus rudis PR-1116 ss-1]|nr:hypothetical protein K474DRAFT_1723542 [Panus rudis PR-1116 ss-1]